MKKIAFKSGRVAKILALCALLLCSANMWAQSKTKIVAHRGYWNTEGAYENTLSALRMAHEVGAGACEFDVNMTSDGVLVVCHGPKVGEIQNVQDATFAQVMAITLPNGEKVPTLEQFLKAAKKGYKVKQPDGSSKTVKLPLVLEIKTHATLEKGREVVAKTAYMLKKMKMETCTDIISFSLDICAEAARQLPNSTVQYLTGDRTPYELKSLGIKGIDYHHSLMLLNPEWIEQAHDLGMKVNVWTVDDASKIETFIKLGVDYITTNEPAMALQLLEKAGK